jgi:hypothetical protein
MARISLTQGGRNVTTGKNTTFEAYDKGTKTYAPVASPIPATNLNPETPINLPSAPTPAPVNPSTPPAVPGFTMQEGQYTPAPTDATAPATSTGTQGFQDLFNQAMSAKTGAFNEMGSAEDRMRKLNEEMDIEGKQKLYNNLTGKLNNIQARAQAELLRTEQDAADSDVTKNVYAGQASRISREAAIQALPIQAQLAAAQGDLASARQYVSEMFQIQSQDALAQYQFKSSVIDSVYQFADKQEQRRLDEIAKVEERKYQEEQDFLKTQNQMLTNALAQGAPAEVIEAISNGKTMLDVITAGGVYNGDVLDRKLKLAQLDALNAPAPASAEVPTVKTINGVDAQWNPQTGRWEPIDMGGAGITSQQQASADSATDTISKLTDLKNHKALDSAVGPNPFSRMAFADSFGAKQDFIGGVEQVTNASTLQTLLDLKSKGGTLGALNKEEFDTLKNAATKINNWAIKDDTGKVQGYDIDQGSFKKELDTLTSLAKKAQINALGYDPDFLEPEENTIIDVYTTSGSTTAFNPASVY